MTRPDGRKHRRDDAPAGPGSVTLTELLDTERALNAMVERAVTDAAAIVAAAREDARRDLAAAEAELAGQLQALDADAAGRTARDLAALAAAATAEAARFDAVPDETVRALADAVVRDFLGVEPLRPGGVSA